MCVLLLHHRTREDLPLVLLGNRDEAFARPFEAPRLLDETWGIVAPRDLEAGGTWLGMNRHGLVAALTNRDMDPAVEGVRSRGLLVLDALAHASAEAAHAWASVHVPTTSYAGFHLVLADASYAFLLRHRAAEATTDGRRLAPGVHLLTNRHEPGEVPLPEGAKPVAGESPDDLVRRLEAFARDDRTVLPGGHRILKHGKTHGTVCSALLLPPRMWFAAAPPDRASFQRVSVTAR